MGLDVRFRQVREYARHSGYEFGFPNFHEADYGEGVVHGCFFVKFGIAEHRDVPRSTLEWQPSRDDIPRMMQAATSYAQARGYPGALPTFHYADYGQGLVYGLMLFNPSHTEFRDIPKSQLGNANINDTGAMFREANDYANAHLPEFKAAIPTFHATDYHDGRGEVRGHVLLRNDAVDWFDLKRDDLAKYTPETSPKAHRGFSNPPARYLLRRVHQYAENAGFVGGLPNFHRADHYGGYHDIHEGRYGVHLLPQSIAEYRELTYEERGGRSYNYDEEQAAFRVANDYASRIGYPAAFPNFNNSLYFSGAITLLKPGTVEHRDVPAYILGRPDHDATAGTIREAHDYAKRHGYVAAFPTFDRAIYDGIEVYGIQLLKSEAIEWRDVQGPVLFPRPIEIEEPKLEVSLFAGLIPTLFVGPIPALHWTSKNADRLEIDQGIGQVSGSTGQLRISPEQNTTYTITATAKDGRKAQASATFTVTGTMTTTLVPDDYHYTGTSDAPLEAAVAPHLAIIEGVKNVSGKDIVLGHTDDVYGASLSFHIKNNQKVSSFNGRLVAGDWVGNRSWVRFPTGYIQIEIDWRISTQ